MIRRNPVSVVVCGHAQHGKSSLLGRLMYDQGLVSDKAIRNATEIAEEIGHAKGIFAILMSVQKKDEYGKGDGPMKLQTKRLARIRLDVDDNNGIVQNNINIIDTPGQSTWFHTSIIGISQADYAFIVVDIDKGAKEGTINTLHSLKGFEVPIACIVISKMDKVGFKEVEYVRVKDEIIKSCKTEGYDISDIPFIPTSVFPDDMNIMEPGDGITVVKYMNWYTGPTFLDALRNLSITKSRGVNRTIITVRSSDCYTSNQYGKTFTAVVESGIVRRNDKYIVEPLTTMKNSKVSISIRNEAYERDVVGIMYRSEDNLEEMTDRMGLIMYKENEKEIKATSRFIAEVWSISSKPILFNSV